MRAPRYPGVIVTIQTYGQDLPEYEHEDNDAADDVAGPTTKIVRFVEATPGDNFAIAIRFEPNFIYRKDDILLHLYLDGSPLDGKWYRPEGDFHRTHSLKGDSRPVNGQWQFEKFAFAQLQTTDEKPKADLKQKLAQIGEVTVKLTRCRAMEYQEPWNERRFQPTVNAAVPEKVLKGRAISNHVTMTTPVACQPPRYKRAEYPWGNQPFVEFKFKYRSRGDLQIEGVIPRDAPLEERDPNTLTLEEARQRIRMQDVQLQGMNRVKREKREHSAIIEKDEDEDTHQNASRRKRSNNQIDLTVSDDEDDEEGDESDEEIEVVNETRTEVEVIDLSGD